MTPIKLIKRLLWIADDNLLVNDARALAAIFCVILTTLACLTAVVFLTFWQPWLGLSIIAAALAYLFYYALHDPTGRTP